eukprot:2052675-Karenia_brevis.AAC.1
MAKIIVDTMGSRGLHINFGAGKTEAIVAVHGPSSLKVKHSLECDHEHCLMVTPGVSIRVVQSFEHLGCHVTHDGGHGPEIAYRKGEMLKAKGALTKAIFNLC